MDKNQILLDPEDKKRFRGYKFRLAGRNRDYVYAIKVVAVHRVVMNAKKGQIVDHINGNKFDNRKENLRFVTPSQNQMNRKLNRNNTSGYKGVCWRGERERWRARIAMKGKYVWSANFETREEAARAYNFAAQRCFGEYARLNKI